MTSEILRDGPDSAGLRLILAHGAGQDMDSPFMTEMARLLAGEQLQLLRFNFPYMAQRNLDGRRRPPDREAKLLDCWRRVIEASGAGYTGRLCIGGKSMGGRMASLIADEMAVAGLVCLGYPFHPPGKPERLRTAHLAALRTPTLICQGERDSFGRREEVAAYDLSPAIQLHWLADGDHGFRPRKASGLSLEQNLEAAAQAIRQFLKVLP